MSKGKRAAGFIEAALRQQYTTAFRSLNTNGQALVDELMQNLRDPLTGIATRRTWFKLLNQKIREACPQLAAWDHLAFPELFRELQVFQCNHVSLHVFFGDVSFLGWVNSFGHAAGDAFIERIGLMMRRLERVDVQLPGRLGGDEFACFFLRQDMNVILTACEELKAGMAKINIPGEHQQLTGHIDLGIAELGEAVCILNQYVVALQRSSYTSFPEGGRALKLLVDTLVGLADARSTIVKIQKRVLLLVELWIEYRPTYLQYVHALRKGAASITDAQIMHLAAQQQEDPEEFQQAVLEYALQPGQTESLLHVLIGAKARKPFLPIPSA